MKSMYNIGIKEDKPIQGIYYMGKWFILLALIGWLLNWWDGKVFLFSCLGALQFTYKYE